jgi:hypothetical protein
MLKFKVNLSDKGIAETVTGCSIPTLLIARGQGRKQPPADLVDPVDSQSLRIIYQTSEGSCLARYLNYL